MRALDRKLFRDLLHMRGQVLAIALVIGCGVATFVMSLSTLESLQRTLDVYYDSYRFADAFAHLKRAPAAQAERLAAIPGVARVQTRVVERVTLDMPGLDEPAVGRLVSLPSRGRAALNDVYLRAGRRLEPGRRREVLVSEAFAAAHGLQPGDTVSAIMNGRREDLAIAGIALSPEFIYQIRPGELLPDDLRYGIFWMDRKELEAAFDMEGAFNDVALQLSRGASEPDVLERVDRITERYGGLGAYGRSDHLSHKFVWNEIEELRAMTAVVPVIFLAVAAFLLNVVLSRLVGTQREQIAALKALGYSRAAIGAHYLKLVLLITAMGLLLGSLAGGVMGLGMTRLYASFFRFPDFGYHLRPAVIGAAALVSAAAAVVGTLGAICRAARLPAAEAMRPQPPASYRPTLAERIGLQRLLSPAARMILRQLERRPVKAMLSCLAIAMATAVLVMGNAMEDAIEHLMDVQYSVAQRYDILTTFSEATSPPALPELAHLPAARHAEPFRAVAARLRAGPRSRRVGLMGVSPQGTLLRVVDMHGRAVTVPDEGLVLSAKLAEILEVEPGDRIAVEVMEGFRPHREALVVDLVEDFSGLSAYMSIEAANRLMREDAGVASGALIAADPQRISEMYRRLKNTPRVAGVTVKDAAMESFRETLAEMLLLMKTFNVAFAVVLAGGVVYNSARISLSERQRELATLRVIGFTRAEISFIQLGELAALTVVAVPGGLVLGYALVVLSARAINTELFRIPAVVYPATFGFATVVIVIATVLSGLVVRRLLDRLDLVAVLKTRE